MISEERKKELIEVIIQQEENWASNYSGFSRGSLNASRELSFSEPLQVHVADRTYCVSKAKLKVTSGGNANSRICFYPEENTWSYLADVVRDSDITDEADIEIGLALSFMGNELSQKMLNNLQNSPSDDIFLNILSRFLK